MRNRPNSRQTALPASLTAPLIAPVMRKSPALLSLLSSFLGGMLGVPATAADKMPLEFSQPHMGTEFVIRLYAASQDEARRAGDGT